ncbi:hypothetical protein [Hufsiella ginkgonis]|uniref:Glycoside hydrolase n=1 Tax=Hufsiella ginkgonis TaxID=2695274 RepID=A0A7K1Y3Y9_9SPHI|nr:hypothetical protein [Hufsiella ginkgonis]MXV17980.1 hypothetical protein [Hufsiella ginkgonis]
MKKIILSISFIFTFVICFAAIVADLTGTWKGLIKFGDQKLELTYKLKAEGEKLTGSIVSSYGEIPLTDGKIAGSDFSYKIDIGGGPQESKGKFMGDSIQITSTFGGNSVTNTFKRVAEK